MLDTDRWIIRKLPWVLGLPIALRLRLRNVWDQDSPNRHAPWSGRLRLERPGLPWRRTPRRAGRYDRGNHLRGNHHRGRDFRGRDLRRIYLRGCDLRRATTRSAIPDASSPAIPAEISGRDHYRVNGFAEPSGFLSEPSVRASDSLH